MSIPPQLVLRPEYRPLIQEPSQPQGGQQPAPFVSREQGGQAGGEAEQGTGTEQAPKDGKGQPGFDPCMSQLPLLLGVVAIFYFLAIRPQQKQEKARKAMLAAVKAGDKVVTTGGIHGTISSLKENTVVLRVDPKVKLTVDRAHIARVLSGEEAAAEPEAGD